MGYREIILNNAIQDYWMEVNWTIIDIVLYAAFIIAAVLFVYMVGYYHGRAKRNSEIIKGE